MQSVCTVQEEGTRQPPACQPVIWAKEEPFTSHPANVLPVVPVLLQVWSHLTNELSMFCFIFFNKGTVVKLKNNIQISEGGSNSYWVTVIAVSVDTSTDGHVHSSQFAFIWLNVKNTYTVIQKNILLVENTLSILQDNVFNWIQQAESSRVWKLYHGSMRLDHL